MKNSPWKTVGESDDEQRTTNLLGINQEIIDRYEWQVGNSPVIVAERLTPSTGPGTSESYDGCPREAPLLHIEYTEN